MSLSTILITVLLLALNAFFVGAEFAAMAARRSQLEPLAEARHVDDVDADPDDHRAPPLTRP